MSTKSHIPSPNIIHLIKEFAYTRVELDKNELNEQVVIDDGCYDFIFFKGDSAMLIDGQGDAFKLSNGVFTIHQLKPPFKFSFEQGFQLFVAKVQPWANASLFPDILEAGIIELKSIYSTHITQLHQVIFQEADFQQKVSLFEAFILSLKIEETPTFATTKTVCEKIYETQGAIKVNELVDIYQMSRQLLNKKFKLQVNYTIKEFIRIVRIISLVKYRIAHDHESLTSVAYQFNYTDQAHFNNDFKKVCGVSPSYFFKNLPIFLNRHKE